MQENPITIIDGQDQYLGLILRGVCAFLEGYLNQPILR
jgi:hypothetical protein